MPRPDWYSGLSSSSPASRAASAARADDRRATVLVDRCGARRAAASCGTRCWGARVSGRLDALAEAFVVPDGYVRRLAADAAVAAQVDGRRAPRLADVRQAARRLGDHVLETKATRLDNEGLSWDDVVTGPTVREELALLEQRCRHREQLADGDRGAADPACARC